MENKARIKTGIDGLDDMLGGGILPESVTVVRGAPGTGKSCICMSFIENGAKIYGENGLIVTFEEFPEQLYRDAASIGINLRELENKSLLRTVFTDPEVFMKEVKKEGGIVESMIEEMNIKRVVIDSMTHIEQIADDKFELREKLYSFLNALLRHQVTVMVTQEDSNIIGSISVAEAGLAFMVDTVIQLRYIEIDSRIQKAVLVLKHRASQHDKRIRRFRITDDGVVVLKPFESQERLLTGNPVSVAKRVTELLK